MIIGRFAFAEGTGRAVTISSVAESSTKRDKLAARIASTPPHMAAMIAEGSVRAGSGARHLSRPVKPTGSGKTAAEYVSDGRR